MKVFKFYSGDYHYGYSGQTEEEAKQLLFEQMGEMQIDKVEEIPESEWDEGTVNMWEENDFDLEPYKESIRNLMMGDTPIFLFTNDMSAF